MSKFIVHFQNNSFYDDLQHALYLKDNINCSITIENGDVIIDCDEDELYNFVSQFCYGDEDYDNIIEMFHDHYITDSVSIRHDVKEIEENIKLLEKKLKMLKGE